MTVHGDCVQHFEDRKHSFWRTWQTNHCHSTVNTNPYLRSLKYFHSQVFHTGVRVDVSQFGVDVSQFWGGCFIVFWFHNLLLFFSRLFNTSGFFGGCFTVTVDHFAPESEDVSQFDCFTTVLRWIFQLTVRHQSLGWISHSWLFHNRVWGGFFTADRSTPEFGVGVSHLTVSQRSLGWISHSWLFHNRVWGGRLEVGCFTTEFGVDAWKLAVSQQSLGWMSDSWLFHTGV